MISENSMSIKSRLPLKIGILSLSLVVQAAGAVAAAVPFIMNDFSDRTTAQIQSILTLPSMAILIFILLSSWFIKALGKKRTVCLGLMIALVGGILPAFTMNFGLILFARILFGAGLGLFNSMTVSLIGDNFTGAEQKNLLGIQSAVMTLGNSLATFAAGLLLTISWQASFLVYLVILPILFLFLFVYRNVNEKPVKTTQPSTTATKRRKLPLSVTLGILTLFLFFISLMVVITSSALLIQELALTNQGFLSTALAIAGIFSSLVALAFGQITKLLKRFTPVVVISFAMVGFFTITLAPTMTVFFIGLLVVYLANLVVPYVYSVILSDVDPEANNLVVSLAMVACNLGAFSSPYVINFISQLLGMTTAVMQVRIAAGIMAIIALIFLFLAFNKTTTPISKEEL